MANRRSFLKFLVAAPIAAVAAKPAISALLTEAPILTAPAVVGRGLSPAYMAMDERGYTVISLMSNPHSVTREMVGLRS